MTFTDKPHPNWTSSNANQSDSDTNLIKVLLIILIVLGIFMVICCVCFYLQYLRFLEVMQLNAAAKAAETKRKKKMRKRDEESTLAYDYSEDVSSLRQSFLHERYHDDRRSTRDRRRDSSGHHQRSTRDRRRRSQHGGRFDENGRGRHPRHSDDRHGQKSGHKPSPSVKSHRQPRSPAQGSSDQCISPTTSPTSNAMNASSTLVYSEIPVWMTHSARDHQEKYYPTEAPPQKELPKQTHEAIDQNAEESTKPTDNGPVNAYQNQ